MLLSFLLYVFSRLQVDESNVGFSFELKIAFFLSKAADFYKIDLVVTLRANDRASHLCFMGSHYTGSSQV